MPSVQIHHLFKPTALALLTGHMLTATAQDVPIVQPGAPGQESRSISAEQAIEISDTGYTRDDVKFMQNMIPHHGQAVEMGELVAQRTNNQALLDIAGRIEKSQADEIAYMQSWLEERGEATEVPHHMHMDHSMMGMATSEQMAELAAAEGTEFDRLFLTLMIPHHEGAVRMVEDLLDQPGSAYDPVLYDFVNDIINDQNAEITRMKDLLDGLSTDPRVGLAAGLHDAGSAISNLQLVASLPKPKGFFDPKNPANIPPIKPDDDEQEDAGKTRDEQDGDAKTNWSERNPLLSFWNTDMAFSEDILVAGSYHGFNVYKLSEQDAPQLTASVICPGGQGDVSIVGDLLIMSVEQTRGRIDCGLEGISEDISDERFRGLRIFDISDLTRPRQVGLVQTCRGSHTHSVVSADDEKIVVYNSGTSSVREEEELAGCIGEVPGDERTALFRIDVVEIPVNDPSKARITSSPAVFADDEGRVAGLWLGGDHGDDTQTTSRTDECHDITVFPTANIAAGACSGNGIILDISDPLNPKRIDDVTDAGFAYWHSATFNNDGTKVLFTDEWGGGVQPRCRASDPMEWGANAIYEIVDGKLEFQSYYKIPAPQSEQENCVAHNGSIVPVPGRDIFAQAWYQGGLSLMDFTDPENPVEIAYFDRGPIHEERRVVAGYWSTYWYNGKIYGTEIIRGLDVLELLPSEFLTENEIAAAKLANMGDVFNPQQQFPVRWPDAPVVALAYLDQMERKSSIEASLASTLRQLMADAQQLIDAQSKNSATAEQITRIARGLEGNSELRSTLMGIAEAI
ncbi:DUF305 domain-containing protein [Aestuariibacter salexigens]|uniref:DUF305 domain-containing protein n=1 Tax=Aestuariibacter salexigens TaxID=226010 RepID=UPI0004193D80|nr:DUF305 domain-containing protein [Aestuariibacter salexigens]